ncbi:hypothetical protein HHUSO_G21607 [Huso huso]|uniref:Uncharacterized protein n=1 Tax=Huso huso TaxID=61971 RepID=A0ABR0YZC5_HUSHU
MSSTAETQGLEDTSCTPPHHSTSGFLQETSAYLLSLKDNKPNYCTARHTFTTGFVVVISLLQLLPETLTKQKYVLTYEVRQDHVELFFNAVRRLVQGCLLSPCDALRCSRRNNRKFNRTGQNRLCSSAVWKENFRT